MGLYLDRAMAELRETGKEVREIIKNPDYKDEDFLRASKKLDDIFVKKYQPLFGKDAKKFASLYTRIINSI